MNYFEFYGIPVGFALDADALKRQYYLNSKKYHPDFHTRSDEQGQAEALEMSALNNEAWKVLSDPDKRMRYVLEIKGLLGDESTTPPLPQDFLMDMMDINEVLMELEFDFDRLTYEKALKDVQNIEQELDTDIHPVLQSYRDQPEMEDTLKKVRDFYLKKRYLLRIQENLSKFASAF
jgi:molecular chaperone HscB